MIIRSRWQNIFVQKEICQERTAKVLKRVKSQQLNKLARQTYFLKFSLCVKRVSEFVSKPYKFFLAFVHSLKLVS